MCIIKTGGEIVKIKGKVVSSFDGAVWSYTCSVSVKDLVTRKEAVARLGDLMRTLGQDVLGE